jgi:hypothetical protein
LPSYSGKCHAVLQHNQNTLLCSVCALKSEMSSEKKQTELLQSTQKLTLKETFSVRILRTQAYTNVLNLFLSDFTHSHGLHVSRNRVTEYTKQTLLYCTKGMTTRVRIRIRFRVRFHVRFANKSDGDPILHPTLNVTVYLQISAKTIQK